MCFVARAGLSTELRLEWYRGRLKEHQVPEALAKVVLQATRHSVGKLVSQATRHLVGKLVSQVIRHLVGTVLLRVPQVERSEAREHSEALEQPGVPLISEPRPP